MRASLACIVLVAAATTSCATAQEPYEGRWVYAERCGLMHAVRLDLTQTGDVVIGTWDEGTRLQADSGRFEGAAKADGLHARLCAADADANACASTSAISDVFVRTGDSLVWSKRSANKSETYLTLHGEGAPDTEQACDDDEPTSSKGDE